MPAPELIDPVTSSILATEGAKSHQANMSHMANGQSFVLEAMRHQYTRGLEQVGMREATAAQELRTTSIGRETLQLRAVADQPK